MRAATWRLKTQWSETVRSKADDFLVSISFSISFALLCEQKKNLLHIIRNLYLDTYIFANVSQMTKITSIFQIFFKWEQRLLKVNEWELEHS